MVLKEKSESGRTMAEMLAVLAIIGVLSITALVGFRYAMELHKENESVDWIVKTVAGSRTGFLLEKYGDEAGFLNPKAVPMQEVISGVAFDFASADDKSSRTYTTPLATKVSVDVISKNAFEVHLENVTFSMCRKLLNGPLEYRFASSNQSEMEILPTSSTEEVDEFCGGIDAARRSPSKPQPEVVTDAVVTLCFSLDREGCSLVPACGRCQIERNDVCLTCEDVGLRCCDDGVCRSVCEVTCDPACDATKCETCVNGVCESKCRDGYVCCPDGTCAATLAECDPNPEICEPDACHVCDNDNNLVNRCPQSGDDADKTKCCTDTIIGEGTVFDKCVRPDESCDDSPSDKVGCGDAGDGCPVTCGSDEICVGSTPSACGGVCRPERSGCGSSGLCEESPCAPGFECVGNVENGCGGTCQPILSGCGDLYECPEQCAPGQKCVGAVENACGGTCSWDPVPPETESETPESTDPNESVSSSELVTPEETSLSEVSESEQVYTSSLESESTSPTETESSSESDTPETSVSGETSGESSDVPEESVSGGNVPTGSPSGWGGCEAEAGSDGFCRSKSDCGGDFDGICTSDCYCKPNEDASGGGACKSKDAPYGIFCPDDYPFKKGNRCYTSSNTGSISTSSMGGKCCPFDKYCTTGKSVICCPNGNYDRPLENFYCEKGACRYCPGSIDELNAGEDIISGTTVNGPQCCSLRGGKWSSAERKCCSADMAKTDKTCCSVFNYVWTDNTCCVNQEQTNESCCKALGSGEWEGGVCLCEKGEKSYDTPNGGSLCCLPEENGVSVSMF